MSRRPQLAVLVSGSGRSLENLCQRSQAGSLSAQVRLVISNRADAYALVRAQQHAIETLLIDPAKQLDAPAFSEQVFRACERAEIDLVVLAGFLRLLLIPERWLGRVINIHPSLLPAFGGKGFYGERVHAAVLARGCQFSGCTVHYVTNEYDAGPILLQRVVPVEAGDDSARLAARVFAAEQEALPAAIERHFAQR